MKKWIGIIALVIIICASAIYTYCLLYPPKPVVFENIVPNNAIYYFSASNLNKSIVELKNSKPFLKLSKTSLYKNQISHSWKDFESMSPFLKSLIDKEVAIAVLSIGNAEDFKNLKNSPIQNIGNVLLLIRVNRNTFPQLKRDIEKACATKGNLISERYHGVKISSFKSSDRKQVINYALLSDTIVASNSIESIKKSVELFKNENTQSLANDIDFQKAVAKIKKDSLLWGYSNHKNYYADYLKQLQGIEDVKTKTMMLQLKPLTSLMETVKDTSFYIGYDNKAMAFIFKSYTILDSSKDQSGFMSIIARDKAINKKVFSLIPNNAIGYYVYNQDALKCWGFLMDFISNPDPKLTKITFSASAIIKLTESLLGVNLKNDLIALLGDDFSIVFASLDELEIPGRMSLPTSTVPPQKSNQHILFPQLYFFCETKDKAKLEKVMNNIFQKIANNINIQTKAATRFDKKTLPDVESTADGLNTPRTDTVIQTPKEEDTPPPPATLPVESYKDVTIHYLKLSTIPFPSIQPNYCIIDKYFVFSISGDLTKKIIKTYKSNYESFNPDVEFSSIKNNLPTEYSIISFFNFQNMIKNVIQSSIFKKFHENLEARSILGFSSADLNSLMAALGTLDKCTITNYKVLGQNVLESQALLTIKE